MANKTFIAAKEEEVKKVAERIKISKLIVLVDYNGITVEDDTQLRKSLREVNTQSSVIKNNIIIDFFLVYHLLCYAIRIC